MKRLLLIFAAALPALAQISADPPCQHMRCYVATTGNVSLSAAATAATLQQPAAAPFDRVYVIKATVYCSVACAVTRSYGGSTASATAGTVTKGVNVIDAPLVLFFTASNSTGGTTVDLSNLAAGETRTWDMSDVVFGSQPNMNYTFSVGSITGNAIISFYMGLR